MRSHRCVIDLKTDSLVFPGADIKINFLSDEKIKKNKHLEEEEIAEQYEKMDMDIDMDQFKKDDVKKDDVKKDDAKKDEKK